jgi:hypothetical protein
MIFDKYNATDVQFFLEFNFLLIIYVVLYSVANGIWAQEAVTFKYLRINFQIIMRTRLLYMHQSTILFFNFYV